MSHDRHTKNLKLQKEHFTKHCKSLCKILDIPYSKELESTLLSLVVKGQLIWKLNFELNKQFMKDCYTPQIESKLEEQFDDLNPG